MSIIDCYSHSHVGNLFTVPVYHPLDEFRTPDLIYADQQGVLIGGGSGEHSCSRIIDVNLCMLMYLDNYIETHTALKGDNDLNELSYKHIQKYRGSSEAHIHIRTNKSNFVNTWSIAENSQFAKRMKSFMIANDIDSSDNYERWIQIFVGEYFFHVAPHTHSQSVKNMVSLIKSHFPRSNDSIMALFNAMTPAVKGYNAFGNALLIDKEAFELAKDEKYADSRPSYVKSVFGYTLIDEGNQDPSDFYIMPKTGVKGDKGITCDIRETSHHQV